MEYQQYIAKARLNCPAGSKVMFSLPSLCMTTGQFQALLRIVHPCLDDV